MPTTALSKRKAMCTLALALLSPTVFAADDGVSRAQVQHELEVYRCAGFNPVADEITYPADVDAARERLAQGDDCQRNRRPPQSPRARDIGQSR